MDTLERIAAALGTDVSEVIYGAKSAPDLAALKREWTRRGIIWGIWLAILYYLLFCCGVWGSWTGGLSYQFSNPDYRVTEKVLPGSLSVDLKLREVYGAYGLHNQVIYEDETGCRITVSALDWDENSGTWNIWFQAKGVTHFYNPWKGVLVTGSMQDAVNPKAYRTDKTAALNVTADGQHHTAVLIGDSVLGRAGANFGYALFPGTGDPAELPETVTLTFEGLLRLTACYYR